ncbi:hypothetical protein U9M48_012413 [Paspalum notatum var. saurae]|uniref:Uncharacterized protein n=1 Tax=Paspalum notatum var. saurae TaxID=547442 RepID=A0AAQ3SXJ9_PASNO
MSTFTNTWTNLSSRPKRQMPPQTPSRGPRGCHVTSGQPRCDRHPKIKGEEEYQSGVVCAQARQAHHACHPTRLQQTPPCSSREREEKKKGEDKRKHRGKGGKGRGGQNCSAPPPTASRDGRLNGKAQGQKRNKNKIKLKLVVEAKPQEIQQGNCPPLLFFSAAPRPRRRLPLRPALLEAKRGSCGPAPASAAVEASRTSYPPPAGCRRRCRSPAQPPPAWTPGPRAAELRLGHQVGAPRFRRRTRTIEASLCVPSERAMERK